MSQAKMTRLLKSFFTLSRKQPQRLTRRRRGTGKTEFLETRTLLTADPGVSLLSPIETPNVLDTGDSDLAGVSEYVFIDAGVSDPDILAEGFDRVGTQVIMLQPDRDGWQQIADHLQGTSELDAIHVVSHGNTGQIFLGSSVYSTANIGESHTELRRIGQTLSDGGDILLYGCNISSEGDELINFVATVTGGDVAASNDVTGADGDWILESTIGSIEADGISFQPAYSVIRC